MKEITNKSAIILGVSLFFSFSTLGYFIQETVSEFKGYERVVSVKGLSEKEYPADKVIWPIQFTLANNDIQNLFAQIDTQSKLIKEFLAKLNLANNIQFSAPAVTDRKAQQYGNADKVEFRYLASQTLTVYSDNVEAVRKAISQIGELGKQGIVFNHNSYSNRVEYSFTRLNEIKPEMIEEATKNAREVAEKFAADSNSSLGKIKTASQGQFSIMSRDSNTPHIKQIRVVSTIQYYLSD